RSPIEYSPEALAEAVAAYRGVEGFVTRASELTGAPGPAGQGPAPPGAGTPPRLPDLPTAFTAALDDDFGVPQALAVVHDKVREGNSALAAGDAEGTARLLAPVRAMLGVLGLDPLAEPWAGRGADDDLRGVVDALVKAALADRQIARERRDY